MMVNYEVDKFDNISQNSLQILEFSQNAIQKLIHGPGVYTNLDWASRQEMLSQTMERETYQIFK